MVSRVEEGGVADRCGVWEGDEVMSVNGRAVREAGWVGTRSALDGKFAQYFLLKKFYFHSSKCVTDLEDLSHRDACF